MDPLTIGVGLAIAGTATSIFGSTQANKANKAVTAAQMRAEQIREQAMTVDADRRRREIIRQGMILRAQALATGVAQGAQHSSSLQGAFGQIAGQTSFGIEGVDLQEGFGHELFAANRQLLAARQSQANAQSIQQIGGSISSLGGAVIGSMGAIDRLSTPSTTQTGSASRNYNAQLTGNTSLT